MEIRAMQTRFTTMMHSISAEVTKAQNSVAGSTNGCTAFGLKKARISFKAARDIQNKEGLMHWISVHLAKSSREDRSLHNPTTPNQQKVRVAKYAMREILEASRIEAWPVYSAMSVELTSWNLRLEMKGGFRFEGKILNEKPKTCNDYLTQLWLWMSELHLLGKSGWCLFLEMLKTKTWKKSLESASSAEILASKVKRKRINKSDAEKLMQNLTWSAQSSSPRQAVSRRF